MPDYLTASQAQLVRRRMRNGLSRKVGDIEGLLLQLGDDDLDLETRIRLSGMLGELRMQVIETALYWWADVRSCFDGLEMGRTGPILSPDPYHNREGAA